MCDDITVFVPKGFSFGFAVPVVEVTLRRSRMPFVSSARLRSTSCVAS